MIYLDNAATSFPKAPGVAEAMGRFLAEDAANPGRAGHRMAVAAETMLDEVRLKLARLVNGSDPSRMIFAMNCTDALNMAIKGVMAELIAGRGGRGGANELGAASEGGPHVVTTVLEHNSVSRPLQAMASQGQIDLTRIGIDDQGMVDPAAIEAALTPATVMVAMTHASNVLGTIQDAAAVGEICRGHDVLFLLDAAQTAGVVPIDVEAMHVDLLAFPGHKSLLGPTGTGALYVGPRCPEPAQAVAATHEAGEMDQILSRGDPPKQGVSPSGGGGGGDDASGQVSSAGTSGGNGGTATAGTSTKRTASLRAWREGGTGGDSATPTQPALYPYYLEGGTPNTVGIAGLGAGIDYVLEHDMAKTLAHEQHLVGLIAKRFAGDERFTLYGKAAGGSAEGCVGTISLTVEGFEPADIGTILDDSFDIAVRPGLHCAPYTHRALGTFPAGTIRISPGAFNTEDEVNQLIEALDQIVL